jgi:putative aldouronate transport system permease protein
MKTGNKKISLVDISIYVILAICGIVLIYPYVNTLAISINNGYDTMRGGVTIYPRKFTLDNFTAVVLNRRIYSGLTVTIARTIVGSITAVLATTIFSYGMSKSHLIGRRFYMKLCIITMYFGGGIIPTWILFNTLKLTDNFLVYIIPNLINVFNMILMVSFFKTIPAAVEESAKIDGAGEFAILFRVVMPVAMPIIAVIILYNAVFQWNSWYDAYLFVHKLELKPLQNVLIDIINESQLDQFLADISIPVRDLKKASVTTKSVVAATMIFTIGPIVLFYPFLQKYFIKGVMIGSVKG